MRFLVFALLVVVAVSATENEGLKRICEPGSVKKIDCNRCVCMPDGSAYVCSTLNCLEKHDQPRQSSQVNKKCPPCDCVCSCS